MVRIACRWVSELTDGCFLKRQQGTGSMEKPKGELDKGLGGGRGKFSATFISSTK